VYRRITGLKFDGHVSYEVGMSARVTAYFTSVSHIHTTRWTLTNSLTQQVVYNVSLFPSPCRLQSVDYRV